MEAYKVGVLIALKNDVSPALAVIAKDVTKLDGLLKAVEATAKSLGVALGVASKEAGGLGKAAVAMGRLEMRLAQSTTNANALAGAMGRVGAAAAAIPRLPPVRRIGVAGGGAGGGGGGRGGGGNPPAGPAPGFLSRQAGLSSFGIPPGAVAGIGGLAILDAMGHVIGKAEEFVQIQKRMSAAGSDQQQVAEAVAKAWQMTAKYQNVSATEALKAIEEARGVFGDAGVAIEHIEPVIRMRSALEAAFGKEKGSEKASESYAAIKSAEMFNKFKPEEFAKAIDDLTKVSIAFGGRVDPRQYLTAQRNANVALQNTDDHFKYGIFPALVQEFGQKAGTMFMTAFNKWGIGVSNRSYALDFMNKMGLLDLSDPNKFQQSKAGLITRIDPSIIKGSDLLIKDPMKFVTEIIKPALEAHGYTTPEKQMQALGMMNVDRNATMFWVTLMNQAPRLEKDAAMVEKVIANYFDTLAKSPEMAKAAFHAQIANLETATGAPLVDTAMSGLYRLGTVIGSIAQSIAGTNPGVVMAFGTGIAAIAAALATAGVYAIGALVAAAVGIPGLLAALAVGIGALVVLNWDKISNPETWKNLATGIWDVVKGVSTAPLPDNGATNSFGVGAGDEYGRLPASKPAYGPPAPGKQSWNVIPNSQPSVIQLSANIHLDNKKVGQANLAYLVREGSGPAHGSPYHDSTWSSDPLDLALVG